MKHLKTLLTTIAVLLCSVTINAHDFEVDGIYYNITSNTDFTVEVTYKGSASSAVYTDSVVIPSSVTYNGITYSVTAIGSSAFQSCGELTGISLPNSVTSIGRNAFQSCGGLTNISLPNSVTSIGRNAFSYCIGLTNISIPNSVTSIENDVFPDCVITKENNVMYVDTWAIGLEDKEQTAYTIRQGTIGLAYGAFENCLNMQTISIPSSVTSINDHAFYGCCDLYNVDIPSSVTSIGSCAFYYCNNLEEVEMPVRVKSIGNSAFFKCYSLTSLSLPDNLETIGNSAFYYCSKLRSLTIPENIISIGSSAFSSCFGLTSVTLNSTAIVEDGNYDNIFGTQVNEYNIGCNVSEIADYAFYNLTSLKKVSLPETIETIGEGAFENCSSLDSIALPANVATIRDYAFASCASLKYIKSDNPIPPSCGVDVFDGIETVACTLEVPDTVATIYAQTSPWDAFSIVMPETVDRIDLIDGAVYDRVVELAVDTVTYTRNYKNTNWQALYIPFAMNYADWAEDFDVAKIYDIHQFDKNNDGDFNDDGIDKTIMEMLIVSSGNLKPNHPYMIRAKSTGEKTITVKDATLMPARSNSIDCSSVELKYTFTGTYNVIDGATIIENNYYFMSGGAVKYLTNPNAQLNPNRWYMQITDREGQVVQDVSEVKVVVRGEDDWDATGIDEIETTGNTFVIHGIDGRMVRKVNANTLGEATEGLASGMYVINGKKHIVK